MFDVFSLIPITKSKIINIISQNYKDNLSLIYFLGIQ